MKATFSAFLAISSDEFKCRQTTRLGNKFAVFFIFFWTFCQEIVTLHFQKMKA